MNRRPVEWLARPDDDQDELPEMTIRIAASWVAVDSDQLILPVVVLDKTGINVNEPYTAIFKQYGGEGLLNDMLMSEQEFEEGSEWLILRHHNLLTVEPAP